MESFNKMIPQAALVTGGDVKIEASAEALAVRDLVDVKFDDQAPADILIIAASSFKVNNAALTGESEPQSGKVECNNENPLETKNLAFFFANAVNGNGGVLLLVLEIAL
ncbi:Sodium/potassium-transporting ATPase subunit alpha [Fasciola hepatica]|uniref:Sodium/potassium-transporting ATPase subunit alpha n=1 Tax=Fasciola hepatica TaxID=6192 RepID=A0A4E0QU02_FASHE|nr:Sodium/potassium-transporting ATPase subunit alpha [Fasciola hepatica]